MPPALCGGFSDFWWAQMGGYWNQTSESGQKYTVTGVIRV